jgi:hypothetical protein
LMTGKEEEEEEEEGFSWGFLPWLAGGLLNLTGPDGLVSGGPFFQRESGVRGGQRAFKLKPIE